jgi:hypothetical protein
MPAWLRGLLGPGDHRRWTYETALSTVPAMNAVAALAGKPPQREVPLMTPADSIPAEQVGVVAYQKPAAVLVMLRDVVGDSVFHAALREYYARWLYKHPYPDDFFNTVESVAGRDLDWFWRPWFHESRSLDLALGDVRSEGAGGAWTARLTLRSAGEVEMPATVRLTLRNGAVRTFRARPAPGTTLPLVVAGLPAAVRGAEVDAEHLLYDVNRGNNVWPAEARPAAGTLFGVTRAGFFALVALAVVAAVLVRAAGLWDGVRLSGFRPARYALGPFSLWTATRGLHLRRIPRPRLYGTGVLAVPPSGATDSEVARGTASLASAGPLASLLAAVVLFPIIYLLERRFDAGLRPHGNLLLDSALVLTGFAAVLAFVRVLRPRRSRGAYIPNAPWVRLLSRSGTPEMQRWSAIRAVTAESFAGIRPRGWNAGWVRRAAALEDGSAAEAGACMLAYLWALDRGDAPEAGAYLDRAAAAAARGWWRFRVRRHVNAERAFFAAYVEGDAGEGARLMSRSSARRAPLHVRRRARTAVLIGEGDLTSASIEARRGLAADARTEAWGGTGIATFERYWLAVLLAAADRRGGAAVVTPTVGSLAVLIGDRPKRRWGFAR